MINAEGLSKTYDHAGHDVIALRDVKFSVQAGQRVAIVGKSGSGKSTLLNLLAGLDHATSGSLSVDGLRLDQMRRAQMARYRCQTVGVVFQSFQLLPHHTALKNVELPLTLGRIPRRERQTLARQWLDRVGLARHRIGICRVRPAQKLSIVLILRRDTSLVRCQLPTSLRASAD